MKKIFICGAVLSLMLWACGDDSSSTGPEQSSGSESVESSSTVVSSSSVVVGSSDSQVPEKTGESSSSTESGSSETVPEPSTTESSSSVSTSDVPCQVVDNMVGSCKDNNSSGDPMVDGAGGGDQAIPPVAYMTVENDSAAYVVKNVRMPCREISGFAGMEKQLLTPSLEVTMDETVMHVRPITESSSASSGCVCSTNFAFKIKLESPFDQASLLVIDDENNLGNRMKIVEN